MVGTSNVGSWNEHHYNFDLIDQANHAFCVVKTESELGYPKKYRVCCPVKQEFEMAHWQMIHYDDLPIKEP